MHIVLDTRFAFPHLSGIGRYAFNLVEGLRRVAPEVRVTVLVPPGARAPVRPDVGQAEVGGSPRSPAQQVLLPRLLRRLGADVFHCPDAFSAVAAPCPTVITVHDLIPLLHRDPASAGLKQKLGPVWEGWLGWQCDHAAAVLTVSEFSRRDILAHLPVDPAKVSVVYPGVRLPDHPSPPMPGHYVLFVGRRDPNKNVAGLVRAMALVEDRTLELVVVGYPDPRFAGAEDAARQLGLERRVRFAGHVSDAEVDGLYRGARALVLASHYEGFGYPPIEAMARGTPAIVSPVTSLPEVAGNAAMYVDPNDPGDIARAIDRVTRDPELRDAMTRAGLERAARFTIEEQARATLAVYRQLAR